MEGPSGCRSALGSLGGFQLVEHGLDPIQGFLRIVDSAGFDVFKALLHGAAQRIEMRFTLAADGGGSIIVGGIGLGSNVHFHAPIIAERLCKILELGPLRTIFLN